MMPLYSTVTGGLISDPSTLDAAYWRNNLQSTVLFNGAVQTLMREAHGPRLFIEIGPHSTLSSPLRQILRLQDADQTSRYIPTLVRSQPQWRALLATAGRLYVNGAPVELSAVNGNTGKVLTDLPSYPWLHEEGFWSETRLVREWRNPREPQHELLGSRSLDSTDIEPSWRRLLDGSHVSWLWDHVMGKDMIFPCAGYIAMAGEAIRQTTGSEEYTIRNLLMKAPLLLKDSEATELVTSFRPVKLSDTADSMWYDFTITAYQNGSWKRHCVGQAKAGPDRPYVSREISPYPRVVPSTPWYEAMKKRRLNFGPRFRRLENISASPSSCQAAACVQCINDDDAVESARYALHPTVIDQSLQMLGVAMTHGISRHLTKLCMPVAIEHIYVRPGRGQMFLDTSCDTAGESITGNTIMVADGTVVLSMEKATLFAIEDTDDANQSGSMVSRLDWKPHIDLVSLTDQLSPCALRNSSAQFLEQLTCSMIVETADKIRSLCPGDPHLRTYQAWLCSQADTIQRDNGREQCVNSLCWEDHLEEAVGELGREIPQLIPLFHLARNISALSADLVVAKIGPQDIGGLDDSSTTVYESLSASAGCGEFFSLLGHSNPKIRVLAVGIGNGFAITQAMRALTSVDGTPMYEKCTVTDRSPDRISQGKESLASIPDIEYIVFDISQDPVEQGLEAESYDLIITSDAFDADRPFSASLGNIKTLLAPGGRLFYQELCPTIPLVTYVIGVFPEWWTQKDRNENKLLITPKQWKIELQEAGFAEDDTVITNDPSPYYLNTTIASRPRTTLTPRRDIALLYLSRITDWARSVEHRLANTGFTITRFALGQQPPPGTDVISMIDLEGPFFDNISADRFSQFQRLVAQVAPSRIFWITESSQMSCNDPRFGLVLGVARTIRHEVMPDFVTLELDRFDDTAMTSVIRVLEHLNERQEHPLLDPDYEFALDEGTVHVSRAHWSAARQQLSAARPANHDGKALDIGSYGLLSSLAWSEQAPRPLRDDEIEVDMRYVGLNFRVSRGFAALHSMAFVC
jgi:SAM-dependent methyltransferase